MPFVSSRRNPLVRRLRALSSKEGREEYSLLLLEGTNLLVEALKTSYMPCEVLLTSRWMNDNPAILKTIPCQTQLREVTDSVLQAALTTINPDVVAALFPIDALPKATSEVDFVLALDRLQDPGNMGTLFRTALAGGVDVLWLALGADPLSQKALRASAGAVLNLPYERMGACEELALKALVDRLDIAVREGYQVVATVAPNAIEMGFSFPYWELDWLKPTVLVLGNESSGIHPSIKGCCTHCITLPHSEAVESLNVASAAVPMLLERQRVKMTFEIQKQR